MLVWQKMHSEKGTYQKRMKSRSPSRSRSTGFVHTHCLVVTCIFFLLHCKRFRLINVNRALIDLTQKHASSNASPDVNQWINLD